MYICIVTLINLYKYLSINITTSTASVYCAMCIHIFIIHLRECDALASPTTLYSVISYSPTTLYSVILCHNTLDTWRGWN